VNTCRRRAPEHGTPKSTSIWRGLSRNQVARQLNLHIQTVRRFANAASPQELSARAQYRPTKLDPYIDLVNQRWNEGVDTARAIHAALRAIGFTGSANIVERYLRPLRPGGDGRRQGQGAPAISVAVASRSSGLQQMGGRTSGFRRRAQRSLGLAGSGLLLRACVTLGHYDSGGTNSPSRSTTTFTVPALPL
jgi:hypothetical protein